MLGQRIHLLQNHQARPKMEKARAKSQEPGEAATSTLEQTNDLATNIGRLSESTTVYRQRSGKFVLSFDNETGDEPAMT